MPAPTGVSLVINGGDVATNDLDVTLTIAATDADEMAFSNNGVDFSPFEIFATTKAFNLSDFNGGAQEGLRTVTLKVRDTFDNAEATATDTIVFEVPEPRISYTAVPKQRSGTRILDINYLGLENSLAAADKVTILDAEIDLVGLFAGGEVPMLEAVDDTLTDGRVGLLFSNAGTAHQLVIDLDKTFGGSEVFSDIVKLRMRAQFGPKIGTFEISQTFCVNTKSPITATPLGRKTIPGRAILLIGIFRDALGELKDTDPSPPQIEEILDPLGVDKLVGGPTTTGVIRVSEGVYRFSFTPATTDLKGQWSYRFKGDVDGVTLRTQGFFIVADPPSLTTPKRDDTCIVFGDLVTVANEPLVDIPVLFTPHHLSDPELENPTTISTKGVRICTDVNGHFEVELIRNTEVLIFIESLSFKRFGVIPDQEIVEYRAIDILLPTGTRDKFGNPV